MEMVFEASEDFKYMHAIDANTSNMNKYDYNHTQNQMLDTKSKATTNKNIRYSIQ